MERRGALLFVGLWAGCGSVKGGADAAVIDGRAVDAPTACARDAPFGAPVQVPGLDTTNSEEHASFSPDELTAYFTSTRPTGIGGADIWYATRATRNDPFGAAALMTGIDTASNEDGAVLTADGLTLYVATDNPTIATSWDIATSTRSSTTAVFGALSDVAGINFPGIDVFPSISPDGTTIYFESQGPTGNATQRIFRATRTTGPFGTPAEVTELMSDGHEGNPVIAADGLSIFFASTGSGGLGIGDIWLATRASISDPFGTPVDVTTVSSTSDDWPVWLSSDNCRLYLASTRAGGSGANDLYVAARN
jgi:Tol biopolymer transport system component